MSYVEPSINQSPVTTIVPGQEYSLATLLDYNPGNDPNVSGVVLEIGVEPGAYTLSGTSAYSSDDTAAVYGIDYNSSAFSAGWWGPEGPWGGSIGDLSSDNVEFISTNPASIYVYFFAVYYTGQEAATTQYIDGDITIQAAPSALTVSPPSQAATLNLTEDSLGNVTTRSQAGTINFTDNVALVVVPDPTFPAPPSATDSFGHSYNLSASQVTALESAFSYQLPSTNSANGSINWTYNPAALNFLSFGETATVTPYFSLSDSQNNLAEASVSITLTGLYPTQQAQAAKEIVESALGYTDNSIKIAAAVQNLQGFDTAVSNANVALNLGTSAATTIADLSTNLQAAGNNALARRAAYGFAVAEIANTFFKAAFVTFITSLIETYGVAATLTATTAVVADASAAFAVGTVIAGAVVAAPVATAVAAAVIAIAAGYAIDAAWDDNIAPLILNGVFSEFIETTPSPPSTTITTTTISSLNLTEGTSGNDLIQQQGSEIVSGGGGRDTYSVAAVASSQATVTRDGNTTTVVLPGATDTLVNIDLLKFSDKTEWIGNAKADFTGAGTSNVLLANSSGSAIDWIVQNGTYQSYNGIGNTAGYNIVGTGDFTGTGIADILLQNGSGSIADWMINNGVYSSYNSVGSAAGYSVLGTGDFNGDGISDVLLQDASGNMIDWLMNNGTYSSYGGIGNANASGYGFVGTGDFSGNGTNDILLENGGGNVIDWMLNNGGYASYNNIGNAGSYGIVGTGDFNGDGTTDILLENGSGNLIDWTLQNGAYAGWNEIGSTSGYAVVGTGDYNGDGTTDILLENSSQNIIDWTVQNGRFSGWHGVGNASGYAVSKTSD